MQLTNIARTKPTWRVVPNTRVALLSEPSKMPGKSWSLPARLSCPRLNGNICAHCYACKGSYVWECVARAQKVRFDWTVQCMRTAEGRNEWITYMVAAIGAVRSEHFRVHDSGDMFNAHYAECWLAVCRALPQKRFWIPTRSWQVPNGALPVFDPLMNALRAMAQLPNVTVRPSALNFGDTAPRVAGLHAGSTADCTKGDYGILPDGGIAWNCAPFQCPSHTTNNKCGDCRACWDAKDVPVSYRKH
jgi:hypothetical protein